MRLIGVSGSGVDKVPGLFLDFEKVCDRKILRRALAKNEKVGIRVKIFILGFSFLKGLPLGFFLIF